MGASLLKDTDLVSNLCQNKMIINGENELVLYVLFDFMNSSIPQIHQEDY